MPGFELVAEHVELDERLAAADVVVTGEGYLDAQSLDGKVVGGVCELAAAAGVPVVVIAGDADPEVAAELGGRATASRCVSLVDRFGEERAFARATLVHRARRASTRSGDQPPATVVVTPTRPAVPRRPRRWSASPRAGEVGERLAGGVGADHHAARSTCRGPCRSAAASGIASVVSPPRSAATDWATAWAAASPAA